LIPVRSRFDSPLFTLGMATMADPSNFSRCPYFDSHVVDDMLKGYDACSATQLAE
jgi:hypothetical protein